MSRFKQILSVISPLILTFLIMIGVMLAERLLIALACGNVNTDNIYYANYNQSCLLFIEYCVLFLILEKKHIRNKFKTWNHLKPNKPVYMYVSTAAIYQLIVLFIMYLGRNLPIFKDYSANVLYTKNAFYIISIALLGPIVEEILFRSIIYDRLKKITNNKHILIIIPSVMFAIYHLNLVQGCFALLFGLILTYTRNNEDTPIPCIIMHIIANVVGLILYHI